MSDRYKLHETRSPIDPSSWRELNQNWELIQSYLRFLERQIKFLSGGAEIDEILLRIDTAIENAENATVDVEQAKQEIEAILVDLNTLVIAAEAATENANTAANKATTLNNTLSSLKTELETLQTNLNGIVQAEVQRVTEETNRRENEAARVLKEQARESAELQRNATFETKMTEADQKTATMRDLISKLVSYNYTPSATYNFPNLIKYNGSTYIALQRITGITPVDDGVNYRLVAEKGAKGDTGAGVNILGQFDDSSELPASGNVGDAYLVGGNLYIWGGTNWVDGGNIKGPRGDTATGINVFDYTINAADTSQVALNEGATINPTDYLYNADTDTIDVYRNSRILYPGLDYNIDEGTIQVIQPVAEPDKTTFYIRVTRVVYRIDEDAGRETIVNALGYTPANDTNLAEVEQRLTTQLAQTVKEVNGIKPTSDGKLTLPVPEVDTSKLASKTELQAVASGSPKGTYATLSALQTAFPTGNPNIYLVTADGKWYYWNGSTWTAGGVYQSTGITDNSIARNKLSDNFSLNGNIANGTDLKTLVNEGVYFGQPNGSYVNAPSELSTNRFFLMRVEVLSATWAIQTIVDFTNPGSSWRRTIHRTNISGVNNPWEYGSSVLNGSLIRTKLADNFNNNGTLPSGANLNDVFKAGTYLGVGTYTYTNIPSDIAGKSFVLTVGIGGAISTFVTQEIVLHEDSTVIYRRMNTNSSNVGTWSKFVAQKDGGISGSISRLSGKKILMFGDSITENGTYPEQVATFLGATVYKAGFGGCRMAKHSQSGNGLLYDKMCMYKLVDFIESGNFTELTQAAEDLVRAVGDDNRTQSYMLANLDFSKIDYISIFFGTNDYGSTDGALIGTNTDTDGNTFKGALNKVISKLCTKVPKAKLMFITPMYRDRYQTVGDGLNSDTYTNSNGLKLSDYVNAIKEICKLHHIPVLDMYEESGINRYNQSYYLADGLHPNTDGYTHVARKIASELEAKF